MNRDVLQQAAAVPLVEQLRSVPADAKLHIDTPNALGCMDTSSIPVGRLCHEAASALQQQEAGSAPQHIIDAAVVGAAWRFAALRVGANKLPQPMPTNYYSMGPQEWCDWALASRVAPQEKS